MNEGQEKQTQSLDTMILRSSGWVALSFGGKNVASMLATLVLARLLEPREFGVVALALTFLLVIENLQSSGLGAAVIYRRTDVEAAASTAQVYASATGILLYGVLFGVAPLLADAFHEEQLTDVLRVLSVLLIIRGLGTGPGAILERDMNFRVRAAAELTGVVVQITVSISLAFAGAGVWSLVAGQLASSATATSIFWTLAPWRPSPRKASWPLLREMIRYGRYVTAGNIITLLNRTSDNLAVGRLLSTTSLGFYSVAFRLADFPTAVIGNIVGRVMFSAYSRLQDDLPAFRAAFVQNLQRVALVGLPVAVVILVTAEPIVLALLGPNWRPVIAPLQILSVYSVVRNFAAPCGAVFQASGKPHLVPLLALPQTIVLLPSLYFLISWKDIAGAGIAQVVAFSAAGIPAIAVAMRILRLEPLALARALAPPFLCCAILGAALLALSPIVEPLSPPVELGLLFGAGAAVYCASVLALAGGVVKPMWISIRGGVGTGTEA